MKLNWGIFLLWKISYKPCIIRFRYIYIYIRYKQIWIIKQNWCNIKNMTGLLSLYRNVYILSNLLFSEYFFPIINLQPTVILPTMQCLFFFKTLYISYSSPQRRCMDVVLTFWRRNNVHTTSFSSRWRCHPACNNIIQPADKPSSPISLPNN